MALMLFLGIIYAIYGEEGVLEFGEVVPSVHEYMEYIYMFTTRLCIVRGGGDNLQFYGSFSFSDVVF